MCFFGSNRSSPSPVATVAQQAVVKQGADANAQQDEMRKRMAASTQPADAMGMADQKTVLGG